MYSFDFEISIKAFILIDAEIFDATYIRRICAYYYESNISKPINYFQTTRQHHTEAEKIR